MVKKKNKTSKAFVKRILSSRPKPKVEKGQRFEECDKRFYRIVEVVKVKGSEVYIKTVASETAPRPSNSFIWTKNELPARITVARKDRFYRHSHGYRRLYGACHECQIKAGAIVPRSGHMGITVQMGTCSVCLDRYATLVPSCDYNWPNENRHAIFD